MDMVDETHGCACLGCNTDEEVYHGLRQGTEAFDKVSLSVEE